MKFVVRHRPLAACIVLCGAALLTSCGNTYRVVVGPISPTPPTPGPEYFPLVLSQPVVDAASNQGFATILTSAGDAVIVQVNVGVEPVYVGLNSAGSPAYVVNLGQPSGASSSTTGSISTFNVISTLISAQVQTTTLPTSSFPGNTTYIPDFVNGGYVYVPTVSTTSNTTQNQISALARSAVACGGVPCVVQTLNMQAPVRNFSGLTTGTRTYAIEPSANQVETIDITTNGPTITGNPLVVGATPVFGVTSPDGNRTFILNSGDGTVTPINSQSNSVMPPTSISVCGANACPTAAPVWADYYNTGSVLVTANSGNNTMSAINVAENDPNFGTVLYTTPVGTNPVSVAVLQSGTYAYTANRGNPGDMTSAGTVSVVNLASGNVDSTIDLSFTDPSTGTVYACVQPVQIATTPGTTLQKVYVRCAGNTQTTSGGAITNASYIWVIRTFHDSSVDGNQDANVIGAIIPIVGNTTWLALQPTR